MQIIRSIKEMILKKVYGHNYSSDSFIAYLREKGVSVGEGTRFYVPKTNVIDISRPYLLTIGNYVRVTEGVKILTHGYDWSVIKRKNGIMYGSAGKVTLGNNVFIGMNSIILKDVNIADNVIIGAGSVVTKDCSVAGVYAGNPARMLMSLDEYIEKKEERMYLEAKTVAKAYYSRYKSIPEKDIFDEFLFLWEDSIDSLSEKFIRQLKTNGNYAESISAYKNKNKKFESFESFIKSIDFED